MLPKGARLRVVDNSGAIEVEIFGHLKGKFGYKRGKPGVVGSIVRVSAKSVYPNRAVKKGQVLLAYIIRTKATTYTKEDGIYSSCGENAAILLNDKRVPIGTSFSGKICREAIITHYKELDKFLSSASANEVY